MVISLNFIHILLLFVALGFNLSATMTIEGSMLSKVNIKNLLVISLGISAIQVGALFIGSLITDAITASTLFQRLSISPDTLTKASISILAIIGVVVLLRSFNEKTIEERRQKDFNNTRLLRFAVLKSINGLLVGSALAIMGVNLTDVLWIVVIINVISTIIGIYIGYWFGYEMKNMATRISGIIILVVSINLVLIV